MYDATVDRVLQSVAQPAAVDRTVLAALLDRRPGSDTVLPLLSARCSATVQAAIVYLGLYGSMRDVPVLALCLHHADRDVAALAEHCIWGLWLRAGTEQGNRTLALAVDLMREGDYQRAIALLTMLVMQEPSFAEAYFQNGLALSSSGRHREALRSYQHALRLNPYHFAAAAAAGHACVELNELAGALRHYRQALRIYPHLEELPEAVRCLEAALGPCPESD